ncbi:MAG: isopeptide-forming domain-containing fimbrial protein, partial [Clostridiales Family XIII bacterium]|nr:isopeptide-forming domain-containing fimbrial protein [Clostridiales Family XIII bacterium]
GSYGDTFASDKGVYTAWVASSNAFKVTDSQYTITMQETSSTAYERVAKVTNLPLSIANTLGPLDTDDKRADYWQFSTVGGNAVGNGDTLMWIRHAGVRNIDTQSWDYIDVKISLRSHDNGASGNNTIAIKKDVRTSVEVYNMQEAFLQWDFYYAGTNTKYVYKSNITFSDIDVDQYLGVRSSDVEKVFADKDTRLKYNELSTSGDVKYRMFAGTVVTSDANEEDAIGYLVDTDSLRMVFGRASGAGHAHFGYYKYSMIPHDDTPPTISKEVTDPDEEGVVSNTLSNKSEHYRYRLETTVPSGMYKGFTEFNITDEIDSCLIIDKVRVDHQSGACEVSEWTKEGGADTAGSDKWFDISVSAGNKVTVSAKKASLDINDNTVFYGGANRESRSVSVTVYVHIDPALSIAQLAAHDHVISQDQLHFENKAAVNVGGTPRPSNVVNTYAPIPRPPSPPSKRVSDPDENDVVSNALKTPAEPFTYKVTQQIPDAYADKSFYTAFRFEDQIDTCLKIEGVAITQSGKGDRTDQFDITVNGNKVVAAAKASLLRSEDFCGGDVRGDTEFTMNVTVRIDPDKPAEMKTHGHYNAAGDLLTFINRASTVFNSGLGTYEQESNDVTTRVALPKKDVTDSDEQKVAADRIINANEMFTYRVRQAILGGMDGVARKYASFTLTDELDSCVNLVSAKVVLDDNTDVSGQFDIAVSGRNVTASAKAPALGSAPFYGGAGGTAYTLLIEAALDQTKTVAELRAHGHYSPAEDEMTFPNKGYAIIDGSPMTSNEVLTKVGVPDLAVTKSVQRYENQVADRVRYTVSVKHTAKSTSDATSVVVRDVSLPDGFAVDIASAKISGIATANKSFAQIGEGFEFRTDCIKLNETAVITFDAVPSKAQNGQIIDNTVTVNAYSMTEEKSASASVYINSPKLDLIKTTHKAEYKVGDTISYSLTLAQVNPGTFMRDVIISDSLTQGGITLLPGSIQVLSETGNVITHLCDITVSGNAFTVIPHLNMGYEDKVIPPKEKGIAPYTSVEVAKKLTVTYDVAVSGHELSGFSVRNTAVSPSRPNTNGDVIKDDRGIPSGGDVEEKNTPIVGAKLNIEKSSDKDIYGIYDTAKYTLKVTQMREDYAARNVVIRDSFETTLASIKDGSVKVTLNKKDITSGCAITASGGALEIATGKDLAWGDTILVTYGVTFDPSAAGQAVTNVCIARADNADEARDENTVGVEPGEAELKIVKTSDKQVCKAGETAKYTLDVSCISSAPAIGVTIKDALDTTGASIVSGSVKVLFHDKDITSGCAVNVSGQAVTIETGKALTKGESITVTYDVLIESFELAGKEMKNIAVASSSNSEDAKDENTVRVELPKAALNIVKTSDKEEYAAGETAKYTVEVTCISSAPALLVKISDKLGTTGASISGSSIRVYLGEEDITSECAIKSSGQDIEAETGKNLNEGETISLKYDVEVNEGFTGDEVKNTASAEAGNADDVSADNTVKISEQSEQDEIASEPGITEDIPDEDASPKDDTPKTGDSPMLPALILIIAISLAGMVIGRLYIRGKAGLRK